MGFEIFIYILRWVTKLIGKICDLPPAHPSSYFMTSPLLHISICSKLGRNFSNTLGFVSILSLCRYASLLNLFSKLTMTFSFSQVHHQIDQNVKLMYNNNENWSYFVSDILNLGKSLKIISLFPQNLGVQRRPFFVLWASQDAWTPFWLKAW
jgi:hypothetical protein